MLTNSLILTLLSLGGCDRSGTNVLPQPNLDFPAVVEVGNLEVISSSQLVELQSQGYNVREWCDNSGTVARETVGNRQQAEGEPLCYYGVVGMTEIGQRGGVTFTFNGTGDDVCLIVDPETVFWNQSVDLDQPRANYAYPDVEEDDGDVDMFAGLSAYYNGSPGVEIGDFTGFYTDSLGAEISIEYGECFQAGAQTGMNNAHSGRATTEYCGLDTVNRENVEYTVVLETFSVPMDDGVLSFAAVVVDGGCSGISPNECTLSGESLNPDTNRANQNTRSCTVELEESFCQGQGALLGFCCNYPDMCGEDANYDEICKPESFEDGGFEFNAENFCDSYPGLCDCTVAE